MKIKNLLVLIILFNSFMVLPSTMFLSKDKQTQSNVAMISNTDKPEVIIDKGLVPAKPDELKDDFDVDVSPIRALFAAENYPGGWHELSYNYRINITISENDGFDRKNWPVDVFVTFNPWANKDGIKIINETGDIVKFQIWNKTGNTTHISSATITILVSVNALSTARYYLYYDIKPVGTPTFPTEVTLGISVDSATGDYIYTIYGQTYQKAVLAPRGSQGGSYVWAGGRIVEITEYGTGLNLFTEPMNDIGLVRNGDLYTPFGDANSNYQPENRYIVEETKNGPIFIMYKVINAPIYDSLNNLIAKANMTYRFYKEGWIVEAYVEWLMDDTDQNAEYWIGGYMFDQDDGADVTFNRVGTPSGIFTIGEGLPQTFSGGIEDWGREDLTNDIRVFITPQLQENQQYTVSLTWDRDVDLDVFIFSERGFLIEGYDDFWDKIDDSDIGNQDYEEVETAVATVNERWIIVVLGYCDPSGSPGTTTFTVNLTTDTTIVATYSGSINSYVYLDRYQAYCNYRDTNYPDTLDTAREGSVAYIIGGYAKRYFADNELATYILPMPLTSGDDYFIELSWDLEFSDVHYHIHYSDGTYWLGDTTGNTPPINATLYPPSGEDYVIVIHYYDGSYYDSDDDSDYDDISLSLYFEPPFAETEDYSDYSTTWNWIGFYHYTYTRGIGIVNISLEGSLDRTVGATQDLYWGNKGEGTSTDEDYILWAIRLHGVAAKAGQWIRSRFAVLLWEDNTSDFISYYADRLIAPLSVSKASIERFNLTVTYNVTDSDNGPVIGAKIELVNKTSGITIASTYTNSLGLGKLDIPRFNNYQLNITLLSGSKNYTLIYDLDYSTIPYTTHSITQNYQYSNLVRLKIKCVDSDNRTLQDADVSFNDSYIYEYSDLLGYVDIYVPKGKWNLTIGYRFTYDQYNLTYTNGTFVKDVSGSNVSQVKSAVISINTGTEWILIDLDATAPLPLSIELREGQLSYNVIWGQNISVKVAIVSLGTLVEAENNVTWRLIFADNSSDVPGLGLNNATRLSKGLYGINVSTYELFADYDYLLVINASVTNYQKPVPLTISIRVSPRPTTLEIISISTNIFWYEKFEVSVKFVDALSGTYLTNAYVSLELTSTTTIQYDLPFTEDAYTLSLEHFEYPIGGYTIKIVATLGNYSTAQFATSLIVNPRPTDLRAPSYVELRWSPSPYNVSIEYYDSRAGLIVSKANTSYEITDVALGTVFANGSLIEKEEYIFSIPIIRLSLGKYVAKIELNKKYHENKTFYITITIEAIRTYAVANVSHVSVYWGETVKIGVEYYDIETYPAELIANATATFKVIPFGQTHPVLSGDLIQTNNKYVLKLNTTDLELGEYRIQITIFKKNYTSQTVEVDIKINSLVGLIIAPDAVEIVWGDQLEFEIRVIDSISSQGLENISYYAELVGLGNYTNYLIFQGNGTFVFRISDTTIFDPTNYTLFVNITAYNYDIPTKYITINLKPLTISLEVRSFSSDVKKLPFISMSEEQKIIEILAYDLSHNKPLENATIGYNVTYGGTTFVSGTMREISPGVYIAVIPWDTAEIGVYTIAIYVKKIYINGKYVVPIEPLTITGLTTTVDWYGGTLWGLPAIIVVPLMIATVSIASFVGYKFYLYMKLPPEVRELDKLIKAIEKGIYEYEPVTREVLFQQIVMENLGL